MRIPICLIALLLGPWALLGQGQPPRPLQFDVVYSCSSGRTKLKVMRCTGTADGDSCEARYIDTTAANGLGAPIGASRKSLTDLVQTCVILQAPGKVPPKAGTPPKPGLTSCAGKIEGRYALPGGLGSMTIIFRSGKAFLPEVMGNGPPEEYECWTGGRQIVLHQPGNPNHIPDMQLDINNDGTLQAPFGELKKKGN